jgi:hypothetical protein
MLEDLIARFEIHNYKAQELWQLSNFELVFLLDDSGSMRCPVQGGRTRWDELRETVSLVVDIGQCFSEGGIDVFFLNRAPVLGVRNSQQLVLLDFATENPNLINQP